VFRIERWATYTITTPGTSSSLSISLNPDPTEIVSKVVDYDDDVAVKISQYDLDREFYVVYTSRVGGGAVSDMEFNLKDALAEMDDDNGTIVARLFEIYQALLSQNEEEEGTPVEAYKRKDIEALSDALNETSWEGSATDVAGCLASNLILQHALPNANHRTAVALIQFYLRRINPDLSMPETKVELDPETYDWREWVNEYINESKRLLTVRRKNVRFKYLREFGATTLERKHGVLIELDEYDLDMYPHEADVLYAQEHEELWRDFVEEAVERAGYPELKDAPGLSKADFAERIRQLE
jgi:prophage maintenance system killer protein